MAENTQISWADHTMNFWAGCSKVSGQLGCAFCYAERDTARYRFVSWGKGVPRRRTSETNWRTPLTWNRRVREKGVSEVVFTNSWADFFDPEAPQEWRDDACKIIDSTPNLIWLILSKRVRNAPKMVPKQWLDRWPPHVWLGVSASNQKNFDQMVDDRLYAEGGGIRLAKWFASLEPLLGEIRLYAYPAFHWVITGGESDGGAGTARPTDPKWLRSLRDQCEEARIPFHFKQWGEWIDEGQIGDRTRPQVPTNIFRDTRDGDRQVIRVGKGRAGRTLDGRTFDAKPPF